MNCTNSCNNNNNNNNNINTQHTHLYKTTQPPNISYDGCCKYSLTFDLINNRNKHNNNSSTRSNHNTDNDNDNASIISNETLSTVSTVSTANSILSEECKDEEKRQVECPLCKKWINRSIESIGKHKTSLECGGLSLIEPQAQSRAKTR